MLTCNGALKCTIFHNSTMSPTNTVPFIKIIIIFKIIIIVWKNIEESNRPQITIWCMRIACWVTNASSRPQL